MFRSKLLIMQKLLNTNAHLGYRTAFSHYQPYLIGFRNQIGIINLDTTLICLRRACSVIELIIRSKGHLLFVNTNTEYNTIIKQTAKQTGQSYLNHKWIGGLLTNWNHMQNVQRHFQFFCFDPSSTSSVTPPVSSMAWDDGSTSHKNTKPNNLENNSTHSRTIVSSFEANTQRSLGIIEGMPRFQKMQKSFEGILPQKLPDCIILFNANQNSNALREAFQLQIPIICCNDSNTFNKLHNMISYPIPANTDSYLFIYVLCNSILKTNHSLFGLTKSAKA